MTCLGCNGAGKVSLPNPAWTPQTPKERRGNMLGPHGRPERVCEPCGGTGEKP